MGTHSKKENWSRGRVALIGGASVAILLVIAAGAVWLLTRPTEEKAPTPDTTDIAASVEQAKKDGELRDEAAERIKSSGADAETLYKKAVDAESSTERKTRLYLDLSGVYYAANQYDKAFDAAEKAADVNSDKFLYADWVSRLYEDQKNYPKAAEAYRLAAKWATSKQNKTAQDKGYYEGKAVEMDKLAAGGNVS